MVVPIVSIPASIEAGLAPYRDLFPRSETYQHIKEYCTGLVVLEKPSINRLAVIYDNPDRQGKPIYCFTRQLTWNATKIVQVRCHRWDIEPLHEQIKQFLGAEDSQLQTEAGVRRHLTLVFVVNLLLKSLDLNQPIKDLPMTEFQDVSPTFGRRCRRILFEVFHDLIQTMARWLE